MDCSYLTEMTQGFQTWGNWSFSLAQGAVVIRAINNTHNNSRLEKALVYTHYGFINHAPDGKALSRSLWTNCCHCAIM